MNSGLPSLNELGVKHYTDKCSAEIKWRNHGAAMYKSSPPHNYLNKYEIFLSHFRQCEFSLLEIGVSAGSSLRMWKEYFPKAKIHGLDINPYCKKHEEERIEIHILDGETEKAFDYLNERDIRPLLLIDDGSHSFQGQRTALESLFPLVQPGGYYILEDLSDNMAKYLLERTNGLSVFDNDLRSIISRMRSLTRQERYIETHADLISFASSFACILHKSEQRPAPGCGRNGPGKRSCRRRAS